MDNPMFSRLKGLFTKQPEGGKEKHIHISDAEENLILFAVGSMAKTLQAEAKETGNEKSQCGARKYWALLHKLENK